jgi:hypothetical protein
MHQRRSFPEHDNMVQALAANRANHPFHIRPLPGRARGGQYLFNPHRLYLFYEFGTKNPIPISQEIARRAVPGKGFSQLVSGPLGRGMGRDAEVEDAPAVVSEHQKNI